jgi:cation/acetate symporter
VLGTAGLPHILVRFYTVPSAKEARRSVAWATTIIGGFYILTTFLGFGAVSQVGPVVIRQLDAGGNSAAPVLALQIGGPLFFAFISAIAFATIVAVVAGLTISASSAIAHDFWLNIVKDGKGTEKEQVLVARITALSVGIAAILLAIVLKGANTAYMVGLAFAVAASANLPVILLTIFWKKFTTTGAVTGILVGLISSIFLILVGPYGFMSHPTAVNGADYSWIFSNIGANGKVLASGSGNVLFNLANPGIISIPLGFLGAWLGSLLSQDKTAEAKYPEVHFRAETGIGSEVAEGDGVLVGSPADA